MDGTAGPARRIDPQLAAQHDPSRKAPPIRRELDEEISMTDFIPTLYIKEKCPFCLKVRIALLEAGLLDKVTVREFAPGTEEETAIKDALAPHLDKVSFPAARVEPDEYIADSDAIIADLLGKAGVDRATLPVLDAYVTGAFSGLMELYRENIALKSRQS